MPFHVLFERLPFNLSAPLPAVQSHGWRYHGWSRNGYDRFKIWSNEFAEVLRNCPNCYARNKTSLCEYVRNQKPLHFLELQAEVFLHSKSKPGSSHQHLPPANRHFFHFDRVIVTHLKPYDCGHGPLTRYAKLWVVHAPGTFFPPPWVSDPDMHHGTCRDAWRDR